jgi:hypothetical protein
MAGSELVKNIGKIHSTKLGIERVKRNLGLEVDDVENWCRRETKKALEIGRSGKNWYVHTEVTVITINAHSYTIITAHKSARK